MVLWELLSKLSCVCLPLEKLVNEKHFPVKEKFSLVFRKVFSFYFGRKTLSKSCEKIRKVMLFDDCIKFDHQTFDCYIFCFEFFFQFHPLEFDLIWFDFYINFGPHFYDCYLLFSYHFLNWIFLSIRFDLYFLLLFFYLKLIYEIVIFLILSSLNFFICQILFLLFRLLFILFEIIYKIRFF